ncbi:hypothetical protein [Solitalea canadensis]|uniref:Lipoprotein n=1 Tax=Solitalea canadensis (strain ATCC 29591 / DSM 3403 / JCM 21819 / LMG 8368 / NBRC 15130 / NCIMB 12057 / USAM 9D) TaxID=929556 RepID=H8KQC5_SOLCM|nr:hypothetical protein [Solitalea canadensis]AFD06420.1 hypothetical protein Solca_1333 [Solitalea canadensis DSM 3403]
MYKKVLPVFVAVSLLIASCGNKAENTNTKGTAPIKTNTLASTATASVGVNPAHGQPGHRCDIPVGAPLNAPAGQSVSIPKMSTVPQNVSAAIQNKGMTTTPTAKPVVQPVSAPVVSSTPVTVNTTTAAVPATTTKKGMNPPHGQPGHRCDIAVGAPLNSASAKTQVTTTTAAAPKAQPVAATTELQKNSDGVPLNPAHGQPGHRCDIAVGAPLTPKK